MGVEMRADRADGRVRLGGEMEARATVQGARSQEQPSRHVALLLLRLPCRDLDGYVGWLEREVYRSGADATQPLPADGPLLWGSGGSPNQRVSAAGWTSTPRRFPARRLVRMGAGRVT
jgi:hypothetical protein